MSKLHGMHEGDRSEYLAMFAMSTIGHCVPVPRQADFFLTDMIVHLFRPDKQSLDALGLEFGLQAKSNTDDIAIEGDQTRVCFFRSLRPFFICVVDRQGGSITVYSTIKRLLLSWTSLERDLLLRFGGDEQTIPEPDEEGVFHLGRPIVKASLDAIESADAAVRGQARHRFAVLMALWAHLETMAIIWRHDHIPWVPVPKKIVTNEPFDFGQGLDYLVVPDRAALTGSIMSLGKSLIAYRTYFAQVLLAGEPPSADEEALRANAVQKLDQLREALLLLGEK